MNFVKQYGARRTGTNAVRAFISRNFADTRVLMHVLGDKHSVPADLPRLAKMASFEHNSAVAFVNAATFSLPAETTRADDIRQATWIAAHATAIFEAQCKNEIRVIVSVRHPYSWLRSIRRYLNLDEVHGCNRLKCEVRHFSFLYQSWLSTLGNTSISSMALRLEDLCVCPQEVGVQMAARLGLVLSNHNVESNRTRVAPSHWDYEDALCFESDSGLADFVFCGGGVSCDEKALFDWRVFEQFGYYSEEPFIRLAQS